MREVVVRPAVDLHFDVLKVLEGSFAGIEAERLTTLGIELVQLRAQVG